MKILSLKTWILLGASLIIVLSAWDYKNSLNDFKSGRLDKKNTQGTEHAIEDIPAFAQKGIDYLAQVQFSNGGWGAGTHANQQMIDPTQVQVDPATTAFAAMALLRAGNTLEKGVYSQNLRKALDYLLNLVEKSPEEGDRITDIEGTQPQVKLGRNIDATMCVQFLIRIEPHTREDKALNDRVSQSINKCLLKIKQSQDEDGNTRGGGWAPVLQSAMANNALELAISTGRDVDQKVLDKSRKNQKENMGASGELRTEKSAGVALYSVTSVQRATAKETRRVQDIMMRGKEDGTLSDNAPVTIENLKKVESTLSDEEAQIIVQAYAQNQSTLSQMKDDNVIAGFGNNGGEEFLSFMLTSESLVITGGEEWNNWKNRMNEMLAKIQNGDGSWNGHHCITSPVFCTAAAILALTAENDKDLLIGEKK
ncbi:MAG: prenyltransferase/squalene oxidase repeat-containing protein [Microscillaceae bacterium]|nr:prenyltransferase/squalene oxidase repeat-containing protein [Microscillaceae bacterium]